MDYMYILLIRNQEEWTLDGCSEDSIKVKYITINGKVFYICI